MQSTKPFAVVLASPASKCPFLYQTATILQRRPRHHQCRSIGSTSTSPAVRNPKARNQAKGSDSRPQSEHSSFLKQKAAQVASNKSKLGSSITPAEQAAFDSIWALFEKPSPSTPKARATSTDHTDTDYKNILELFSSLPPEPNEVLGRLEEDAGIDHENLTREGVQPISPSPGHGPLILDTPKPPVIQPKLNRASAMKEIQGFLKETAGPTSSISKSTDATQAAALRMVEDVADGLTAALVSTNPRPDIAMWQVAEEKIFPLLKLLSPSTSTLSSPPPSETAAPLPSGDVSMQQAQQQPQQQTTIHLLIPSDIPLLPLLSQAYPSLTLLILRLYTTHHPTSPYTLALLPTLKSLGPTSYVLGAHTHFYNTILSLYWRIYSDLRGMNTLLVEMDTNGVEFDLGTWDVLNMVGEDRETDLSGSGQRGSRWWGRMEQRVWWERVGVEWKAVVRRRLVEKGVLPGEVMREEEDVTSGLVEDEQRPAYVVTL